jgi:hypothetical protein
MGPLPSATDMATRRISFVFLMAILLTVLYPFSPFSWLMPTSAPELLDYFLSPSLLLGALFFQYRIAGIIVPSLIRVADSVFVYKQDYSWTLATGELVICMGVNMIKSMILRRVAGVGVVGTSQKIKNDAWEHLKWIWTWMAFNEARRMV